MINKWVIIIGGGNGFRLSLIVGFRNEGYELVLPGRGVEKLNGQVQQTNLLKKKIYTFCADITCHKSMEIAFERIKAPNRPLRY